MLHTANIEALIGAAKAAGATVLDTNHATIIVATKSAPVGDDLVPLAVLAAELGCPVARLKAAGRAGALPIFGRQRSRVARRGDAHAWLESERTPVRAGIVDSDMTKRMRRIGAKKARA